LSSSPAIVWYRQDLRLADNPALSAAVQSGRPVLPVYILDDDAPTREKMARWRMGGASRWWLYLNLASLGKSLAKAGSPLILRRGAAEQELEKLRKETGAGAVHWNRCYEPWAIARDKTIKADLGKAGIEAQSFNGALLYQPWTVKTGSGGSFFASSIRCCRARNSIRAAPMSANGCRR
jgi:deoxyribodipyrimidine photo-lyase